MFSNSKATADQVLAKAKKVAKGATLADAGIDHGWMTTYASVAQRLDVDRRYGLTRYPYEPGPAMMAFVGGYFDHREWPPRKQLLESQRSMRPVAEYEAKYVNAAGYWCSFHQSAIDLRDTAIDEKKKEEAERLDVWAIIAVRYSLRVLGLRTEFYKMATVDPVHAKLILPTLEHRTEMPASEDLDEPLEKMESHMSTQLMKAVATLAASNATKKAAGNGGRAADG